MIKIAFVIVGGEINCIGGRRVAAVTKKMADLTDIYYIIPTSKTGLLTTLDIDIISEKFALYDIVCFSSMTYTVDNVFAIAKRVKERNNKVFTLLGGVHATLFPDDAIEKVDAICIGEGEKPMQRFLEMYKDEKEYYNTEGLWFNKGGGILKNPTEALNTNDELNIYQIGQDSLNSWIYDVGIKQFVRITKFHYLEFNRLEYPTIWTLGCPYTCSYCSNSGFAQIDKNYRKLRYPKPEIVVREIEDAISRHPYISTISFYDDNMIALPFNVLESFCSLYKSKINLPFTMYGIHPNTINKEKVELLSSSGMIRTKMGIQSGNQNTLELYKRNTSLEKIRSGVTILADAQKKYKMMSPRYDIICDNPVETREDIISSLRFYNTLRRPFLFNIFSLRVFPGTKLTYYFKENNIKCAESFYFKIRPTFSNVILYLIACVKIPNWILEKLLPKVKGYEEEQKEYPVLLKILSRLFYYKYFINHFNRLFCPFRVITGKWLFIYWKFFIKKNKSLKVLSDRDNEEQMV